MCPSPKQQIRQSRPRPFQSPSDEVISRPNSISTAVFGDVVVGLSHERARNIQAKVRVKVLRSKPLLRAMARIHVDQQSAEMRSCSGAFIDDLDGSRSWMDRVAGFVAVDNSSIRMSC
jgi:hypothetical protein